MQYESALYTSDMARARRLKHLLLCEPGIEILAPIEINRLGSPAHKVASAFGINRSNHEICVLVTTRLEDVERVERLTEANGGTYDNWASTMLFNLDGETLEALERLTGWDEHLSSIPGLIDNTREGLRDH